MTGEPVQMLNERDVTARKEHRCDECGRAIQSGERYRKEAMLNEGDFVVYKTCEHCLQVRRWLGVVCRGWVYGAVEEDLLDHVTGDEDYLRTRPLTRMARWMRADWQDRAGNLRPSVDVSYVATEALTAYKRQMAAVGTGE